MKLKALLLTAFLVLCSSLQAQFFWPENPEERSEAETLWTLFDDVYGQGDYEAAKPYLDQIIEKFPGLSTAVYINGLKVWKDTYKNSKDAAVKKETADKIMTLYEKRFDNFDGEKKKAIDRKAMDAFQYYYKDASKTQELLDLFEEAYELKGNDAYYPLGRYYMNMATFAYVRKVITDDDEVLRIYDRCTEHIDYQIAKSKNAGKSTNRQVAIKEFIDKKLADLKLVDCDFVVEKLVPEFEQDPDNAELANKIFAFAFEGGCTDADWFVKAAEKVFASNPQYGVGYLLGVKFGSEKDYDKSKSYFTQAAELTDDNTDKAKALKQVAATERIQGNKAEAKKFALQAAEVDPTLKEDMYTLIGDMIMGSDECDKKESQVTDRARFIAAHNYYIQGKNNLKAGQAREYFPTISDIFTEGKKEGDNLKVGCWIQTSVKLVRRPEQ
ncbi:tetratricopeptide repeat protein [Roseivirga misakiensis]|uniref:Uncharacterized protein n=1 Tax=Roseivirga misakiensis TaxID=1563681 RepID=A0A1E5T6H8_9BACT|nr:hypothetical protein [Roseivirga misakiensis]OEK06985.1 hypothetical protein BFP71_04825 [Roseivirga misakiensis]